MSKALPVCSFQITERNEGQKGWMVIPQTIQDKVMVELEALSVPPLRSGSAIRIKMLVALLKVSPVKAEFDELRFEGACIPALAS